MKQCVVAVVWFACTGCVAYPVEFCPGYGPAHELTDSLLASFNANARLWSAGTKPETDALKEAGWVHSSWEERRVVVCTNDRASMHAFLSHHRGDGSKIGTDDLLYAFKRDGAGWIIAGKSRNAL